MLRHQTTVLQPIGKLHAVIVKSRAPRGATGSRQRGIRIITFQCYNENPEDYYNSNGQWASNPGARSGNKWHVRETHHRETWLRGNRLGFIRQILATDLIKVPFLRTDEIIIDNQAEGMQSYSRHRQSRYSIKESFLCCCLSVTTGLQYPA